MGTATAELLSPPAHSSPACAALTTVMCTSHLQLMRQHAGKPDARWSIAGVCAHMRTHSCMPEHTKRYLQKPGDSRLAIQKQCGRHNAMSTNKNKRLQPRHPPTPQHEASIIHCRLWKGVEKKPRRCQQTKVVRGYQAFPSKPLLKFPSNSPAHGPLSRWALSLAACQQQLAPCLLKTKMTD